MATQIWPSASTGRERMEPYGYNAVEVLDAPDLEAAFVAGQNGEHPWNPERPTRSLSVGDVLTTEEGAWRVAAAG